MNLTKNQLVVTVLVASLFLIQADAGENLALKTPKDKANYATGVNIVRKLKQQGGEVNLDIVIQGMKDGLTDYRLLMSEDEISAATVRKALRIPKQKESGIAQSYSRQTGASMAEKPAPSGQTAAAEMGKKDPVKDTAKDSAAEQVVQSSLNPTGGGTSLAERGRTRNLIKRRGLEQRQKTMMQERGGG